MSEPRVKPPDGWIFREGTHDREIWRTVCECDEYGIEKLTPGPQDVFIDIGAHIGCASWMAYRQGFRNIAAFEASQANRLVAMTNLFLSGVIPQSYFDGPDRWIYRLAVWGRDRDRLHYQESNNRENTGGGDVLAESGGDVDAISFDDILLYNLPVDRKLLVSKREIVPTGKVFVKLDCEYSEFQILLTSKELHRIHWIGMEYHERGDGTFWEKERPIPSWAAIPGYESWTGAALQAHLEQHGFKCTRNHEAENIGKLFAVRE